MFGVLLNHFDSLMITKADSYFRHMLDIQDSKLPIKINIVDKVDKKGSDGVCIPVFANDSTVDNLIIESLKINIKNSGTTIGMIEALAHELVHAKQFTVKELTVGLERKYYFGFIPYLKSYRYWKGNDVGGVDYHDLPYEQEAFLFQKKMTLEFLNAYQNNIEPNAMAKLLKAGNI